MNDREKHQATMMEKQAQMGLIAQKAQAAAQTAQQRQSDMAQRGQERRAHAAVQEPGRGFPASLGGEHGNLSVERGRWSPAW